MNKKNIVIILFGFSGAGKSTIAEMLGEKYGLRVVHPSSILRQALEGKTINIKNSWAGKGFWESDAGVKLFKKRLQAKRPMELTVDRLLLKELVKGNIVMDSWSMPWLSKAGVKMYLKTSQAERVRRVAKRSKVSLKHAAKVIKMKDNDTRAMYKSFKGFDIKKDLEVFDFILDTSRLNRQQVFGKICKYLES